MYIFITFPSLVRALLIEMISSSSLTGSEGKPRSSVLLVLGVVLIVRLGIRSNERLRWRQVVQFLHDF